MALSDELGFRRPIDARAHEAVLSIFVTASLLGKEADRVLQPFGLTQAHFDILMLLRYQTADGSADQTTLGKMLVVNRSNVTGLVDRMERDGLLGRASCPSDARGSFAILTDAGRDRLAALCRSLETVRTALREEPAPRRPAPLAPLAQRRRKP